MVEQPGTFVDIVRIEPEIFFEHIITPLWDHVNLPRGYRADANYLLTGTVHRRREGQLGREDRLLRWMLVMRGMPISLLAYLFGQSPRTVYYDFVHISVIAFEHLSPVHLRPMVVGSAEYYAKRGQGPFRFFPNCVYAADVVKV